MTREMTLTNLAFALALAALVDEAPAQSATKSSDRCIGLPLPALRGTDGNATDLAGGVREIVSSFLNGPSLRTVALEARLPEQALEEARAQSCGTVLTVIMSRKKAGSGALTRALSDAAGAAAWHMPYGGSNSTSTAVRSAAIAGTAAAASIASNVRAKDELQIEYRLASSEGTKLREGKDKAKASADGEDLVTPLVERMASDVAAALPR